MNSLKKEFFRKVSGQVSLLPRWALGNWWSRYWDYSQEELKSLMEEFKEIEGLKWELKVNYFDLFTETYND